MAAEQIIHPASPPPDAPKYYYPGFYYYTPEPYQTTHVPNKQHHLFHHVVHLPGPLRHAVHDLARPYGDHYPLPAPPCDIRETGRAYHLDVELPGAGGNKDDDVRLRWTGTRTLFVAAKTRRGHIPPHDDDDDEGGDITTTTTVKPPLAPADLGDSTSSSSSSSSESEESEEEKKKSKKKKRAQKKKNKKNKVHFLKKERKTGAVARAFNFPVDVQQDKTVARLAHGVLSIVVPKKTPQVVAAAAGERGEEGHREVEIEHAGH